MKIYLVLIAGIILGIMAALLLPFLNRNKLKNNPYFVLKKDYKIGDAGMLQKGTIIKFDEGMDEGFDRFVLYLNIKNIDIEKADTLRPDQVIPYWLND